MAILLKELMCMKSIIKVLLNIIYGNQEHKGKVIERLNNMNS